MWWRDDLFGVFAGFGGIRFLGHLREWLGFGLAFGHRDGDFLLGGIKVGKDLVAFLDIQPVNAGHVLVVPREHYEVLQDIPKEVGAHLYQVAAKLIPVVQTAADATDMNIVVNSGAAAGQNVMHYHIHLIPRKNGDGFDVPLPFPGSVMPNRQQLDAMAALIGSMLRDPLRNGGMKA